MEGKVGGADLEVAERVQLLRWEDQQVHVEVISVKETGGRPSSSYLRRPP